MGEERFELVGIGRNRFNGTVVGDEDDLLREVSKHLFSREISIVFDDQNKVGTVFAGFRSVGTVLRVQP